MRDTAVLLSALRTYTITTQQAAFNCVCMYAQLRTAVRKSAFNSVPVIALGTTLRQTNVALGRSPSATTLVQGPRPKATPKGSRHTHQGRSQELTSEAPRAVRKS
jgi:hypothetical protein